jgi:hypothetical protein
MVVVSNTPSCFTSTKKKAPSTCIESLVVGWCKELYTGNTNICKSFTRCGLLQNVVKWQWYVSCVISCFHCDVNGIWALPGFYAMQNINSIQRFETTSESHRLGSSSPTRIQRTFWYTVYMGNVVGGDWFSDDVMPANCGSQTWICSEV